MNNQVSLDAIDQQILELLVDDGRRTVRDIASLVGLSVAPVSRRIRRLEAVGIITGYTALLNHRKVGNEIEAIVEIKVSGEASLNMITSIFRKSSKVQEVLLISGGADAMVRVRASSIEDLNGVIDTLRGSQIVGTRTLVVLKSWKSPQFS